MSRNHRWRIAAVAIASVLAGALAGTAPAAHAAVPLTVPGSVTAVATSTGTIHVSWTDTNDGAAQYVVSNGNVSSATLPVGTQSYDWPDLAPSTYMCFTVTAKENGLQSPWSPYGCTTTWPLTTPPSVTATSTGTGSVLVNWADVTNGGASYVVSNGNTSVDIPAGTSYYTWTAGLSAHTYMCFTVAAKQSGQQSPWSPYACTTTVDPPWCPIFDTSPPTCSDVGAFQQEWSFPTDDFDTQVPQFTQSCGPVTCAGPDQEILDQALELQAALGTIGPHAQGLFSHYLDVSGTDYTFDSTDAYHAATGFAAAVDATVRQRIGWLSPGATIFDSGWNDFDAAGSGQSWGSSDWQFAIGHCYYRVTGTQQADGSWGVHLQLTSYYQFSPGTDFTKPVAWMTATVTGQSMHRLAIIGAARNFRTIGNGDLTYSQDGYPLS